MAKDNYHDRQAPGWRAFAAEAAVVNALIGFVQEGKAEQVLDARRRMLTLRTLAGRREA
jgi:hypothetical protein